MRALPVLCLPLALAACSPDGWSPDELTHGSAADQRQLERGRALYATYCAGCHGEKGDGAGPAARFLSPKPRDLRKGRIKFAAVPAGMPPRDEDLIRILDHGLPGSAMPSFALLAEDEQRAIVAYVRTFSDAWKKPPGAPVAIGADPWRKKPAQAIALGEELYHGMAGCSGCHAAYAPRAKIKAHLAAAGLPFEGLRPDLYRPIPKDSEWGAPITPPDFLVDRLRAGAAHDDLVRTIGAGVGGTAMPSWASALKNDQLWALAYYVESLATLRGTPAARQLQRELERSP